MILKKPEYLSQGLNPTENPGIEPIEATSADEQSSVEVQQPTTTVQQPATMQSVATQPTNTTLKDLIGGNAQQPVVATNSTPSPYAKAANPAVTPESIATLPNVPQNSYLAEPNVGNKQLIQPLPTTTASAIVSADARPKVLNNGNRYRQPIDTSNDQYLGKDYVAPNSFDTNLEFNKKEAARKAAEEDIPLWDALKPYFKDPELTKEEEAKQERSNNAIKSLGGLADLGAIVGDFVKAGAGAPVGARGSLSGGLNARLEQLSDKYKQAVDKYGAQRAQIMMQDYLEKAKNKQRAIELAQKNAAMQNENMWKMLGYNQKQAEMKQAQDNFLLKFGSDEKKWNAQQKLEAAKLGIAREELNIKKNNPTDSKFDVETVGDKTYNIPKNETQSAIGNAYDAIMTKYAKILTTDDSKLKPNELEIKSNLKLMIDYFKGGNLKDVVAVYKNKFPNDIDNAWSKYRQGASAQGAPTTKIDPITGQPVKPKAF